MWTDQPVGPGRPVGEAPVKSCEPDPDTDAYHIIEFDVPLI